VLSLGGPVLGTAIVAAAGVSLATVLDAVSFAASAALVATIGYRRAVRDEPSGRGVIAGMLGDLAEGFRSIAASRAIMVGLILITGSNLALFIIEGNLVYLVLHVEHQAKVALGVVFSAQGAGAIAGAAVAPRLLARIGTGRLLAAGMAASTAGMAIPVVAPQFPAIVAAQVVEGGAGALIVVCWFSAVQRLIPEQVIGRFVSASRAIAYVVIPAGALLGAWLLNVSAAIRPLFGCAAALQLAIVLVTIRSPLLRIDAAEAGPAVAPASQASA
jgi:Na+/melibiose symporter-like transporter